MFLVLVILAVPAAARDDHIRPYTEGVAAADAADWTTVIAKMQQAIAHEPAESRSIRTRSGPIPYVPHYWLGIALASIERWDAALLELALSEKQGVVQHTTFYSKLRATKSSIEARKATASSSAGVEDARKLADTALQSAMAAQASATSAGASRLAEFRQASQKLQEALASRKDGTVAAYRKMAESASEATTLFNTAASKASVQPAGVKVQQSRPPAVTTPSSAPPQPVETREPEPIVQVVEVETSKPVVRNEPPPVVPVQREPEPAPEPAPEPERRPASTSSPAVSDPPLPTAQPGRAPIAASHERVESAYRSMVYGDLQGSSALLTNVLASEPRSVEALVLRGYVRYLQSVLQREETMLDAAEEDFRAALAIDPRIRLDERNFSPKAVRYFEEVRASEDN